MEIDIAKLAAETAALLAPFLPYLIKGGKLAAQAAIEKTGEIFAEKSWEQAEKVWGKLKPKLKNNPGAKNAIDKAARKPNDKRVVGNLEVELEELLEKDKALARFINESIFIGGDVKDSIINKGNENLIATHGGRITKVTKNYKVTSEKEVGNSPEELTRTYLRNLALDCEKLPLGVIHSKFQKIGNEDAVSLQNVYTDLDIRPRQREERKRNEVEFMEREPQRVPVLSALNDSKLRRLVLLGDPGSGKTTCVHYMTFALCMAHQKLEDTKKLFPKGSKLSRYFPIRLVLREVAALYISPTAQAGSVDIIWNAIRGDLSKRLGEEQARRLFPHLQKRIQNTTCIIMLDGLDEVPESEERRARLLESIELFSASLPKESIVLVTARPYAYDDPKWHLPHFETLELLPFSKEQIEGFISRFYQAMRPIMDWDENTATHRASELNTAVQKEEYLYKLAERPLLLTLIATVDTSGGKLPEDRADLYEETVGLLLQRWQRRIETRKEDGTVLAEESILKALSVDNKRVRDALHKLAYEVHDRQGREATRKQNAPADIRKEEILGAFASILPDDAPAKALLAYLETRAGILLGIGEGIYNFPHRSFQEYLAACYLNDQPNPTEQLNDVFLRDANWWREVVLLGIAKIQRGGLGSAVNAVNTLVPCGPKEMDEEIDLIHWQAAALAGQALIEMRLKEKSADQILYKTIIKRVVNWLVQLLEQNALSPRERAEAGVTLAKLGDPRLGVLADFVFCHIPKGKFRMGEDKEQFEYAIPEDYFMSRYPITNAQFDLFVQAEGYKMEKYWDAAIKPGFWSKDGFKGRYDDEVRTAPISFNAPFNLPNHPVVGVSWYEAVAFCKWLNEDIQNYEIGILKEASMPANDLKSKIANRKWEIRLPSEAEWERAARGRKSFRYPWGDEITPNHANYSDTNIGATSAVGAFPLGTNDYGLLDMSGNVWEWCATQWQDGYKDYLKKEQGLNSPEGDDLRVARGGAFGYEVRSVRCAYRNWYNPDGRNGSFGFRVVVVLVSHFS